MSTTTDSAKKILSLGWANYWTGDAASYPPNSHFVSCFPGDMNLRFDHGFVVTGIFPWMVTELGVDEGEASEVAVISRTYLERNEIDRTLPGIRSLILDPDPAWWGADDVGLPIITWITAATPESQEMLQAYTRLPPDWLGYVLRGSPVVVAPTGINDVRLWWAPKDTYEQEGRGR